jgi:hypothetical protein
VVVAPRRSLALLALVAGCAPQPPQPPAPTPIVDDSPELPPALRAAPQPRPFAYPSATVIYLAFDGATITKGVGSDAPSSVSYLCGATFPAFDHSPYGGDRGQVIASVVAAVAQLFADFNVRVESSRPAVPPYDMVVVGGTSGQCAGYKDGLGGLGPLDCDDAMRSDISFAFAGTLRGIDALAVTIAHEAAHGYGLRHTLDGCDLMSYSLCAGGLAGKRFLDKELAVAPDQAAKCGGAPTTNPWRRLEALLGLRPGARDASAEHGGRRDATPRDSLAGEPPRAPPSSGCALAPHPPPGALAPLALLLLGLARRGHAGLDS